MDESISQLGNITTKSSSVLISSAASVVQSEESSPTSSPPTSEILQEQNPSQSYEVTTKFSLLSIDPTTPVALSKESNSISPSPTSEIFQQQNYTRPMTLRNKGEVIQALTQSPVKPSELHLYGICIDDGLVWLLIESKLKKLFLQNCIFRIEGAYYLSDIFKFLAGSNSWGSSSKFAVQFNGCVTRWILCDDLSDLEFNGNEPITTLLFILSENVSHHSLLNGISSLALLPKDGRLHSSQFNRDLRSFIICQYPTLKTLLLRNILFTEDIEDFISISESKLDLIYLWECDLPKSSNPTWNTLNASLLLVDWVQMGTNARIGNFQFTINTNGHIAQIIINKSSFFLVLNSPDLGHGLILSLEQDLPNDLLFDNIFFIALFSLGKDLSTRKLTPQSRKNLSSILCHLYPKSRCLMLRGIDFNGNIEDHFSFPHMKQMKLDLLYLWKCRFKTLNPIWSTLCSSPELFNLMQGKPEHSDFTIITNGHITHIVNCRISSLYLPTLSSSSAGYILSLGQNLLNGFSLDPIPSRSSKPPLMEHLDDRLSFQFRQNFSFLMNHRYSNLNYILLEDRKFRGTFQSFNYSVPLGSDPTSLPLSVPEMQMMSLMMSEVTSGPNTGRFDEDVLRVLFPQSSLPDLFHGLIVTLGQNLPNDFTFNDVSFLVFLPSETNFSNEQLFSQFRGSLKSIHSHRYPKLKYLFLKGVSIANMKELLDLTRQLRLKVNVHTLKDSDEL